MKFFLWGTLLTGTILPIVACHRKELNAWEKLAKYLDGLDFTKAPFTGAGGIGTLGKNSTPEEKANFILKWIRDYIKIANLSSPSPDPSTIKTILEFYLNN